MATEDADDLAPLFGDGEGPEESGRDALPSSAPGPSGRGDGGSGADGDDYACSPCGGELETTAPRIHRCPGQPTRAEIEAHRDSWHLNFRSWCPECVAGRATGEQHRRRPQEYAVPILAFDYLLITKDQRVVRRDEEHEKGNIIMKVLVAKDSASKAIFAHAVTNKGPGEDRYAVNCLVEDIKWLGHTAVGLKSDNEPAIVKLLTEVLTAM